LTNNLIICRGIPASGKSTQSKKWVSEDFENRARVNRDDLRFTIFGKYVGLTWQQEELLTEIERDLVKTLLQSGKDVVVDSMSLRPKYVREWMKFADRNKANLAVWEFPISLEDAIRRDSERDKSVGEDVLRNIWNKYTKKGKFLPVEYTDAPDLEYLEPYLPNPELPPAIIIDIDGTIAHNDGHRGWYEYDKVYADSPKQNVIDVVLALINSGYYPVFCSGRTDDCYDDTLAWIEEYVGVKVNTLLMRKTGDRRKDSIIKYEIFNEHIRNNYRVVAAFDDRRQVTEMWRGIGLTVLQCEFGDY